MQFPSRDEYHGAIQNPERVFEDPDIRSGEFERNSNGLPIAWSGGTTITYHLTKNSTQWAIRCFIREIPDIEKRYEQITQFIKTSENSLFVNCQCISNGIKIGNNWFPIIKMQWISGETLGEYLSKNFQSPDKILFIMEQFRIIALFLEKTGIAHGDLQHGNIMIKDEQTYLIDYDGLFLPTLETFKPNEKGHKNYQHPLRENIYNDKIDRFSCIVIYFSLFIISQKPQLFEEFHDEDNIIFKNSDFTNPESSSLIEEIEELADFKQLIDCFKRCCKAPFKDTPTLEEFLQEIPENEDKKKDTDSYLTKMLSKFFPRSTRMNETKSKPQAQNISVPFTDKNDDTLDPETDNRQEHSPSPPPILNLKPTISHSIIDASDKQSLQKHVGELVDIVGFIELPYYNLPRKNPMIFDYFEQNKNVTFKFILWNEQVMEKFIEAKKDPRKMQNKYVSVRGKLLDFSIIGLHLQIKEPFQIQILNEEQYKNRISYILHHKRGESQLC